MTTLGAGVKMTGGSGVGGSDSDEPGPGIGVGLDAVIDTSVSSDSTGGLLGGFVQPGHSMILKANTMTQIRLHVLTAITVSVHRRI